MERRVFGRRQCPRSVAASGVSATKPSLWRRSYSGAPARVAFVGCSRWSGAAKVTLLLSGRQRSPQDRWPLRVRRAFAVSRVRNPRAAASAALRGAAPSPGTKHGPVRCYAGATQLCGCARPRCLWACGVSQAGHPSKRFHRWSDERSGRCDGSRHRDCQPKPEQTLSSTSLGAIVVDKPACAINVAMYSYILASTPLRHRHRASSARSLRTDLRRGP
jgi:hypothetical protein